MSVARILLVLNYFLGTRASLCRFSEVAEKTGPRKSAGYRGEHARHYAKFSNSLEKRYFWEHARHYGDFSSSLKKLNEEFFWEHVHHYGDFSNSLKKRPDERALVIFLGNIARYYSDFSSSLKKRP